METMEERRRTLKRRRMTTLPRRMAKAAKINHINGKIFTSKPKVSRN